MNGNTKPGVLMPFFEDHWRGGVSTLSAVQEEEWVAHLRDNLYARAVDSHR